MMTGSTQLHHADDNGHTTHVARDNKFPKRVAHANRYDYEDLHPAKLNPSLVIKAIKEYVDGRPESLLTIFHWIMRVDLSISGIMETRRDAVEKTDWEILPGVSNDESPDFNLAVEAAAWATELLSSIESFDRLLSHVLDGNRYGVTLTEIIWGEGDGTEHIPREFIPVNQSSVISSPTHVWDIHVTTVDSPHEGEPLSNFPNKFVVSRSRKIGNSPWGGALAIPTTLSGVYKRLGWQWFLSFCEKYGNPLIWGTWQDDATDGDKDKLELWLKNFRHNGYAGFPEGFAIEALSLSKSGDSLPQRDLISTVDEQVARGVLGQTLTSGTQGDTGSFAMAKVHNMVRMDIRDNDMAREAEAIRRGLLMPMIRFGPFRRAPVPYFSRVVDEERELDRMIELGERTPIPRQLLYEAANVPVPEGVDGKELIQLGKSATPADPANESAREIILTDIPHVTLPTLARKGSPHTVLSQWVSSGVDAGRRQVHEIFKIVKAIEWPANVDKSAAAEILGRALDKTPTDQLREVSEEFIVATLLAGGYNAGRQIQKKSGVELATEPNLNIYTKTFREAIEALRQRVALPANIFARLSGPMKARAGRVAGLFNVRLVQTIYDTIAKIIESGGTVSDFQREIRRIEASREWGTSNPNHVRLVFQQNATMSYQAGGYEQSVAAGAVGYFWRARGRSCQTCKPYIDLPFTLKDLWTFPGFTHFGCDCWAEYFFADEVGGKLIRRISEVPNPRLVELRQRPGALTGNPRDFAKIEPVNLESVQRGLRGVFRKFVGDV